MLTTTNLELVAWNPQALLILIEDPAHAEQALGFSIAPGLREFFVSGHVSPLWLESLRKSVGADPWRHGFFVVHRESNQVIGSAGFKGAPDPAGAVEIAYAIVPSFERRGFATEAANALLAFARQDAGVSKVLAHTLPQENPSTSVLRKCGFRHVASVVDPDDGEVWRWELSL